MSERFLEHSDDEILGVPSEESEIEDDDIDLPKNSVANKRLNDDPLSESSRSPSPDPDTEGWGASKQDYYNADVIETEADALEEEKEARRLQQKQLQQMTEADYGFDEVEWATAGKDEALPTQGQIFRQSLPMVEISEDMDPEERMRILRTNYPEFEPLANEFLDLQSLYKQLAEAARLSTVDRVKPHNAIKYRALGGYLAAISIYFAIFLHGPEDGASRTAPLPPLELREHPVMGTLARCREQWEKIKNLGIPSNDGKNSDSSEEDMPLAPIEIPNGIVAQPIETKTSSKQNNIDAAQEESARRRQKRLAALDRDLASLSALAKPTHITQSPKPIPNGDASDASDFGDPTSLTTKEAAEKALRKKSLKYYTAQIAGKASRRDAATRNAGGDEDIPYRERLRDRQERLTKAAQVKAGKGADLDVTADSDEEDVPKAADREAGPEEEDAEGYYDFISRKAADRKAAKAAAAASAAQGLGIINRITDGDGAPLPDGKRGISYTIEKNKGLAPKRKKEVRNPRVKKRKKFEEKQKRLKSIRQVYKPEREGKGGYGGEMTGIKKGLVRSVKL